MAERVAGSGLLPTACARVGQGEAEVLDAIHQQVQVIEDRTALEEWLAKERGRRRAAGEDIDGLAYGPARVHPEAEEDGHGVHQTPVSHRHRCPGTSRQANASTGSNLGDPGFGKTWLLHYEPHRIWL